MSCIARAANAEVGMPRVLGGGAVFKPPFQAHYRLLKPKPGRGGHRIGEGKQEYVDDRGAPVPVNGDEDVVGQHENHEVVNIESVTDRPEVDQSRPAQPGDGRLSRVGGHQPDAAGEHQVDRQDREGSSLLRPSDRRQDAVSHRDDDDCEREQRHDHQSSSNSDQPPGNPLLVGENRRQDTADGEAVGPPQ